MTSPAPHPLPRPKLILAARIKAMAEIHGYSVSGLSLAMGHARSWLGEKLNEDAAKHRAMTLDHVDEVVAFLRAPHDALLWPVVSEGDAHALGAIAAGDTSAAALSAIFDGATAAIDNLAAQGLVVDVGETLTITELGRLAWQRHQGHSD